MKFKSLECACLGSQHRVRIHFEDDINQLSLSVITDHYSSFYGRVKIAWKVLFNQSVIVADVLLNEDEYLSLGTELVSHHLRLQIKNTKSIINAHSEALNNPNSLIGNSLGAWRY